MELSEEAEVWSPAIFQIITLHNRDGIVPSRGPPKTRWSTASRAPTCSSDMCPMILLEQEHEHKLEIMTLPVEHVVLCRFCVQNRPEPKTQKYWGRETLWRCVHQLSLLSPNILCCPLLSMIVLKCPWMSSTAFLYCRCRVSVVTLDLRDLLLTPSFSLHLCGVHWLFICCELCWWWTWPDTFSWLQTDMMVSVVMSQRRQSDLKSIFHPDQFPTGNTSAWSTYLWDNEPGWTLKHSQDFISLQTSFLYST